MSADPSPECCQIDRRGFLLLTATAVVAAGCEAVHSGSNPAPGSARVVDAGPASGYANEGVYAQYRALGFFLVRRGSQFTALSSLCTHRHCKLDAEADHTFYCPCHGSTFDPTGKVTEGPAKRPLPVFATSTDARGHLLVTVTG
ncbi:MAG: Rieske 2Fe-2S domain-containing protein [Chthoniobacter sp.]|uniref:QcrA and Rieske domain-containing protein n=1 Tax=Chthoniobacter sp. TaxID=2510640 RepID=UPI0032A75176